MRKYCFSVKLPGNYMLLKGSNVQLKITYSRIPVLFLVKT